MKTQADIVIVGGGMVGGSLALALAQQTDLHICLLESRPPALLQANDPWQLRVSAINAASQSFLTDIGVWEQLIPERLGPFETMQVWEKTSQLDFSAMEIGEPWLGHIIENGHLEQAIYRQLQAEKSVTLIAPASAVGFSEQTVTLENGDSITATLVIAADGNQSQIRNWAGIKTRGWKYHQQGLVAVVETEYPHQQCARQRFLSGGPLAFLPLSQAHQSSIVWSLPDQEADAMLELDEPAFCEQLAEAFDFKLGSVKLVSKRAAFPLILQHAETYVQQGLALVGDAAHSVHPLAGQGVNLGFQDTVKLAEVISEARKHHRAIDSLHTLKKYQRARLAENTLMQLGLDGFNRLFTSQLPGIASLRQFGLTQVNQFGFLKNRLAKHAAGN